MHQDRPTVSFPYEILLDQGIGCQTHQASPVEFPWQYSTHLRLPTVHHRYHALYYTKVLHLRLCIFHWPPKYGYSKHIEYLSKSGRVNV